MAQYCKGKNVDGTACDNAPLDGQEFCLDHLTNRNYISVANKPARRKLRWGCVATLITVLVGIIAVAANSTQIMTFLGYQFFRQKTCVVTGGANVFDQPTIIFEATYNLPATTKVHVINQTSSGISLMYEIDRAEIDMGKEVLDKGPLVIKSVTAGSAAEKAGILAGDILISFDRHTVNNIFESLAYISDKQGKRVAVQVERNGENMEFTAIPDKVDGAPRLGVELDGGKFQGVLKIGVHGYISALTVKCDQ